MTVTRNCCVLPEMGELCDPLLTLPVDVGHSLPGTLKQHGLKLLKVLVHRAGCLPVKLLQQNTMGTKVEIVQKEKKPISYYKHILCILPFQKRSS